MQRYHTPADIGRAVGITPAAIRELVRRKRLVPDARTVRGTALFREATVRRLVRRRQANGRSPIAA